MRLEELVTNLTLVWLQPHRIDEHESIHPRLVERGHLRSDERAETETDDRRAADSELIEQQRHDRSEIAHRTHPVAALGSVPAGQGRQDHVVRLRELLMKRQPAGIAGLVVDHERRRTLAGALQGDRQARDFDRGFDWGV